MGASHSFRQPKLANFIDSSVSSFLAALQAKRVFPARSRPLCVDCSKATSYEKGLRSILKRPSPEAGRARRICSCLEAFLDYQLGISGKSVRLLVVLLTAMWTLVIVDILDLAAPRIGEFRTGVAVYEWTLQGFKGGVTIPPSP